VAQLGLGAARHQSKVCEAHRAKNGGAAN
jgi:hypothetical protein